MNDVSLIRIAPIESEFELASLTGVNDPDYLNSMFSMYRLWKVVDDQPVPASRTDPNIIDASDIRKADALIYGRRLKIITPYKYKGDFWAMKSNLFEGIDVFLDNIGKVSTEENIWEDTFGKNWKSVQEQFGNDYFAALEKYKPERKEVELPQVRGSRKVESTNKLFGFIRILNEKDKVQIVITEKIKRFEDTDEYLLFEVENKNTLKGFNTTIPVPTSKGHVMLEISNGNIVKIKPSNGNLTTVDLDKYSSGNTKFTVSLKKVRGALIELV